MAVYEETLGITNTCTLRASVQISCHFSVFGHANSTASRVCVDTPSINKNVFVAMIMLMSVRTCIYA